VRRPPSCSLPNGRSAAPAGWAGAAPSTASTASPPPTANGWGSQSPDGRQRSYAAIRDDVLHARHGDQLAQRDHWAQTAVTASSQLAVWEKIQTDNPDYGAHGPRAVQLAMRMFQRETPQERAYRDYLAHQEQRNRIHR